MNIAAQCFVFSLYRGQFMPVAEIARRHGKGRRAGHSGKTDIALAATLDAARDLNLSGDLNNSGTIAGRTVVSLSAENVRNLGGRIRGNDLGIQARTDLDNIGGTIEAMHTLSASAGRDLNVLSTSRTQTNAQGSRTHIDRVAGLYVTGSSGTLIASAGRDLNLNAAAILNAAATPSPLAGEGTGSTTIAAGNNLKLGTVSEAQQHDLAWDSRNYRKENSRRDIGTTTHQRGQVLTCRHHLIAVIAMTHKRS